MPGFSGSGAALTDANYRVVLYTLDNQRRAAARFGDGVARLSWSVREVDAGPRESPVREVIRGVTDAPAAVGMGMRATHLLGGEPLWFQVVSAIGRRSEGVWDIVGDEIRTPIPGGA